MTYLIAFFVGTRMKSFRHPRTRFQETIRGSMFIELGLGGSSRRMTSPWLRNVAVFLSLVAQELLYSNSVGGANYCNKSDGSSRFFPDLARIGDCQHVRHVSFKVMVELLHHQLQ